MLLATTSCSQDEEIIRQSNEMTTFKVELEGSTKSRTAGDGQTVDKLYYAVYDKDGGNVIYPNTDVKYGTETVKDGKASVELPLMKSEKYDIVFWAQKEGSSAYSFTNLKEIKVNYPTDGTLLSNQENRDAFFNALDNYTADGNTQTVELRRPFAQLNVATTLADWEEATRLYQANGGTGDPVKSSEVTISQLATTFNALSGVASGNTESVLFNKAELLKETNENGDEVVESIFIEKEADDGTTSKKEYKLLAMNYLLMAGEKEPQGIEEHQPATGDVTKATVEVDFTLWKDDATEIVSAKVPSAPIQRNYRTNILGQFLTGDYTKFEIVVEDEFDGDHNKEIISVNPSDDLNYLLQNSNGEDLVFDLDVDGRAVRKYTVDVTSWQDKAWGGENTKTITINANGNEIEFNLMDSDWSHVTMKNLNGKLIINDAILSSTKYNTGHWKRNLTHFACNVEFNNVTVNGTGIGVKNDAVLNDVTINQVAGNYSFWVWANGKTVNVDKLTVNTPEGRAIKIADEDADGGLVTLNVSNSKFTTNEKAAILVTSKDGAAIKLENIDLSGVKADGFNAVWVDEERADYANLITVTGGFKTIEPADGKPSNPFLTENATVELPAGTYVFPAEVAKGVTINCAEGVVFAGQSNLNINGATVNGATFSNPEGTAVRNTINGTFKNCNFEGSNAFRYCYAGETVVFENCVFDGAVYGVHFDGGANDVMFKNCTLSGFNAFGSALTQLTFEGCTFKSTGKSGYNGANLWGATKLINTTFEFDGSASTEWIGINAADSNKDIVFENCKVSGDKELLDYFANYNSGNKVTVDGKIYSLVEDNDALKKAIEDKTVSLISLEEGTTFEGTFAIGREVVIRSKADNKATIKGRVNISGDASFSNIKFDINDDSKVKNSFTGGQYKYPGIVMIYAAATTFEGCEFKSDIASSVCGINYGAHAEGKLLTVNNCSFEGDYYAIRSRTQFSVTNSKFNIYTTQGKLCAVWTWGNGNDWANSVTFTGNENLNENEINSVQLASTNFTYNNMDINVQGNTGFAKLEDSINPACTFSEIRFAEGSERFSF